MFFHIHSHLIASEWCVSRVRVFENKNDESEMNDSLYSTLRLTRCRM